MSDFFPSRDVIFWFHSTRKRTATFVYLLFPGGNGTNHNESNEISDSLLILINTGTSVLLVARHPNLSGESARWLPLVVVLARPKLIILMIIPWFVGRVVSFLVSPCFGCKPRESVAGPNRSGWAQTRDRRRQYRLLAYYSDHGGDHDYKCAQLYQFERQ